MARAFALATVLAIFCAVEATAGHDWKLGWPMKWTAFVQVTFPATRKVYTEREYYDHTRDYMRIDRTYLDGKENISAISLNRTVYMVNNILKECITVKAPVSPPKPTWYVNNPTCTYGHPNEWRKNAEGDYIHVNFTFCPTLPPFPFYYYQYPENGRPFQLIGNEGGDIKMPIIVNEFVNIDEGVNDDIFALPAECHHKPQFVDTVHDLGHKFLLLQH